MSSFSRSKSQILFRYSPGSVFKHDDYGLCKVKEVEIDTSKSDSINQQSLREAVLDAVRSWDEPMRENFPDIRDPSDLQQYFAYGPPQRVRFSPYPTHMKCTECGHVKGQNDLERESMPTRCPDCGDGRLSQLSYVQIHNCGRIEELYLPECSKHGSVSLVLYDPGYVSDAYWYCGICGQKLRGLRMSPCNCNYSEHRAEGQYDSYMSTTAATDPSVHLPQTTPFINLPSSQRSRFANPDLAPRVLSRTWRLDDQALEGTQKSESSDMLDDVLEELGEDQLQEIAASSEKIQDALDRRENQQERDREINELAQELSEIEPGLGQQRVLDRRIPEHATLLETLDFTRLENVASWTEDRGEDGKAERLRNTGENIRRQLGLLDVAALDNFPLALCSFGYTRVMRDPGRTEIRPYDALSDGRFPLYVIPSNTEALWFQLDPRRVARWLIANGHANGETPSDLMDAWLWIYREAPSLWRRAQAEEEMSASLIETLLHSMSHTLLRRIEWSGFSGSSIGEYLLPGTLSFVLYVNQHGEGSLGGLLTLFEQRLGNWLQATVEGGNECIVDPLCSDEGGACFGCLHRKHGCATFNSKLSRSTLYGGPLPGRDGLQGQTIQEGYWTRALGQSSISSPSE